jgi:hypothetical protein
MNRFAEIIIIVKMMVLLRIYALRTIMDNISLTLGLWVPTNRELTICNS